MLRPRGAVAVRSSVNEPICSGASTPFITWYVLDQLRSRLEALIVWILGILYCGRFFFAAAVLSLRPQAIPADAPGLLMTQFPSEDGGAALRVAEVTYSHCNETWASAGCPYWMGPNCWRQSAFGPCPTGSRRLTGSEAGILFDPSASEGLAAPNSARHAVCQTAGRSGVDPLR